MASLRTLLDSPLTTDIAPTTFVGENAHQIMFRGSSLLGTW